MEQLLALKEHLHEHYKLKMEDLPKFPKKTVGKPKKKDLEERRVLFEAYYNALLQKEDVVMDEKLNEMFSNPNGKKEMRLFEVPSTTRRTEKRKKEDLISFFEDNKTSQSKDTDTEVHIDDDSQDEYMSESEDEDHLFVIYSKKSDISSEEVVPSSAPAVNYMNKAKPLSKKEEKETLPKRSGTASSKPSPLSPANTSPPPSYSSANNPNSQQNQTLENRTTFQPSHTRKKSAPEISAAIYNHPNQDPHKNSANVKRAKPLPSKKTPPAITTPPPNIVYSNSPKSEHKFNSTKTVPKELASFAPTAHTLNLGSNVHVQALLDQQTKSKELLGDVRKNKPKRAKTYAKSNVKPKPTISPHMFVDPKEEAKQVRTSQKIVVKKRKKDTTPLAELLELQTKHRLCAFGASLQEMMEEQQKAGLSFDLPLFMLTCLRAMEDKEGQKAEGIFRVSSAFSESNQYLESLKKRDWSFFPSASLHAVTRIFKSWLRELPINVIEPHLEEQALQVKTKKDALLVVNKLSEHHKSVMIHLLSFLRSVIANMESTKMDAESLSRVISPNLFPQHNAESITTPSALLLLTNKQLVFLTCLLSN